MEHGSSHPDERSARAGAGIPGSGATSDELIAAGYEKIRRPDQAELEPQPVPAATQAEAGSVPPLRPARRRPPPGSPPPPARPGPPTRTEPPSPFREPRRFGAGILIAVSLLILGTAGVVAFLAAGSDEPQPAAATVVTVVERVQTEIINTDEPFTAAAAVGRAVIPSIVTVEVGEADDSGFTIQGSGSGVVWTSTGYIVTNEHVVVNSPDVRVVLADGRIYDARVVGTDPYTDLAVIHIDAVGLSPITQGETVGLEIGDPAIAIGNPLGLEGGPSLTVGVISAFNREVQTGPQDFLFGMLQTDAPITRGSSGGALVDAQGRLIGITSAIGVSDVGVEGIGFAIPVELVERVTTDLIEVGRARHSFLGVTGDTSFTTTADGAQSPAGVRIEEVVDGSAAAAAGLAPGDVITAVNGEPVVTMDGLIITLRNFTVGEDIRVELKRDGAPMEVTVTLGERPGA